MYWRSGTLLRWRGLPMVIRTAGTLRRDMRWHFRPLYVSLEPEGRR